MRACLIVVALLGSTIAMSPKSWLRGELRIWRRWRARQKVCRYRFTRSKRKHISWRTAAHSNQNSFEQCVSRSIREDADRHIASGRRQRFRSWDFDGSRLRFYHRFAGSRKEKVRTVSRRTPKMDRGESGLGLPSAIPGLADVGQKQENGKARRASPSRASFAKCIRTTVKHFGR